MDIELIEPSVHLITEGEKKWYLVGTAHISKESVALAEKIIREHRPDSVAIELCASRFQTLRNPERWKNTDIVQVLKQKRGYLLLTQLVLAAFQRRLGKSLDIAPGAEMVAAANAAEAINAQIVLADREVKTTFKRVWSNLTWSSTVQLMVAMFRGLFEKKTLSAEEIEKMKSSDMLEELLQDFTTAFPDIKIPLIEERDKYLTAKTKSAPGPTVVAVVGAGHIPGMLKWFDTPIALEELEKIPGKSLVNRIVTVLIVLVALTAIIYMVSAPVAGTQKLILTWVISTSLASFIGGLLCLAHPLTILTATIVAPFTAINPWLRSGWIAAIVEATLKKPRVADLETVADDITTLKGWYKNRLAHVLYVLLVVNIFGMIGAFVAAVKYF